MNPGIYGLGGQIVTPVQGPFSGTADARKLLAVQFLVVGGAGGAPGGQATFGPGPGGGGGGVASGSFGALLGSAYDVVIGAGGATGSSSSTPGSLSRFGPTTAGGGGAAISNAGNMINGASTTGGSAGNTRVSPFLTTQGFAGGIGIASGQLAGGGGGAGGQGGDGTTGQCGSGGIGVLSSVPATPRYFGAGGGGGSNQISGSTAAAASGGQDGGGAGAGASGSGTAGDANTGGGGGGGRAGGTSPRNGSNGGSGVVVLRWNASQAVATLSSGLTATRSTAGTDTVMTITAGTGTITWS